jgi:hypothetical protein
MKIIISPSKTQKAITEEKTKTSRPMFHEQAVNLARIIKEMDPDAVQRAFHIKGDLLKRTVEYYSSFNEGPCESAVEVYTGQVFKQLSLSEKERVYFDEHLIILSALYGVLRPFDSIENYRLDMKVKLLEGNTLYGYWMPYMKEYFNGMGPLINLASVEFSKMIPYPKIDIIFKEKTDKGPRVVGTYSKIARGQLLRYMAANQIEDIETVKLFNYEGYQYNHDESNDQSIVFLR